jgi:steroid delta-isomerase-like uncharacterized protein
VNYNFSVKWLKAFRTSSEEVCALYEDEGFSFSDPMLDQYDVNTKPDLLRLFEPYANKDPDNGIGIHNFRIRGYVGDERSGLIRWEWGPEHAGAFLGIPCEGKPFQIKGHTYHEYNEAGKITFESSWWDASSFFRQIGETADKEPTAPAGVAA